MESGELKKCWYDRLAMLVETLDLMYRGAYKFYLTKGDAKIDREIAHNRAVKLLKVMSTFLPADYGKFLEYDDPILEFENANQRYRRRIGLAAGLDKTGEFLRYSKNFGAAFDVVGGVTKLEFDGANHPRIVADRHGLGLMNWMKFPNPGQEKVAKTIDEEVSSIDRARFKIIVNTAVSAESIEGGRVIEDFEDVNLFFLRRDIDVLEANFGHLATPGYQGEVANQSVLASVIRHSVEFNQCGIYKPKIISAKLSMDLANDALLSRVKAAIYLGVDQINIGNTTRRPEILEKLDLYFPDQGGGYCGPLARPFVLEKIRLVGELCRKHQKTLIVSAGIDDWSSAVEAHIAGADLIQSLQGFLNPKTGGLGFFWRINRGVTKFCQKVGVGNVDKLKDRSDLLEFLNPEGDEIDIDWN